MTISNDAQAAGRAIQAAPDRMVDTLNAALAHFIGSRFGAAAGIIVDLHGNQSSNFGSIIRVRSEVDTSDGVPADRTAVALDVCEELTLGALSSCYQRIAEAKRLRKTPVPKGELRSNITMGIIFAAHASVPLETIADALDRLNRQTPSQYWPDMIVVGDVGVVSYGVQFPGEGVSGAFLPPQEGATDKYSPAVYVVPLMTPSGSLSFNKMLAYILPHLNLFEPGSKDTLPNYEAVLENVPKTSVTLGGYQYNLAGQLVPVPREHYNDR